MIKHYRGKPAKYEYTSFGKEDLIEFLYKRLQPFKYFQKTANGYYIYIEASRPRQENDEARLSTPSLRPGQYCVTFFYHMFGSAVGRLSVLSQEGVDGATRVRWMAQRNQRDQWHRAEFEYNSIDRSKSIQFLFYGRVGSTSSSDIALDDINITSGRCQFSRTTTSSVTTTTPRVTARPVTKTTPSTTVRPPPTTTNGREIWSGMPRM